MTMARSPSRSMRPRTRPGMEDIDNNVTRMTQGPRRPEPRPRDKAADFEEGRAVERGNRQSRLEAEALEERDERRGYAEGGMVRGCKAGQMSGKGFSGTY